MMWPYLLRSVCAVILLFHQCLVRSDAFHITSSTHHHLVKKSSCTSPSSPVESSSVRFQSLAQDTESRNSKVFENRDNKDTGIKVNVEGELNDGDDDDDDEAKKKAEFEIFKLQGKLLKQMRQVCLDYNMLEDGDNIMVCVSGGKDSAVLLYLLLLMQHKLPVNFNLTAVHVDQKQPGYDGLPLVEWLEQLGVAFQIIEEDTYSVVVDKTPQNKSFCAVCSRLRRGILYSHALDIGCNKIVLGHHADDAMETLFLNMFHGGQMRGMPARYTSERGSLAVMRPLIKSMESDIERFAQLKEFPILPCNLCKNQANLQRPQMKLLLETVQGLNPDAKINLLNAMGNINPGHLLDKNLRQSCGLDPVTGETTALVEQDGL